MKGSVLELGGKDPMIVLADANLRNAVSGALWGGFANAGQTCSGIERVYVMRDVAERFTDGLVARRAGAARRRPDGLDAPRSGRWSRSEQYDLVAELVDDAVANGADAATAAARSHGPAARPRRDASTRRRS